MKMYVSVMLISTYGMEVQEELIHQFNTEKPFWRRGSFILHVFIFCYFLVLLPLNLYDGI